MLKINVIVEDINWLRFLNNPNIYLKQKIKKIQNDKFFKKKNYSFSIKLSNEKEIKLLNKKFRKKNKSTDILSFPQQSKKKLKKISTLTQEIYLGDIIINFKKMTTSSKILFKNHLKILLVHGLVHLFGYDHKKESSYKKMHLIENRLLKKIK